MVTTFLHTSHFGRLLLVKGPNTIYFLLCGHVAMVTENKDVRMACLFENILDYIRSMFEI